MKQKNIFLLPLLSLLFVQNARAFCDSATTGVYITMDPGNVKYITTRSKHDFIHASKQPVSPNTLGLTVAHLNITGDARPNIEKEDDKICVSLGTLNFKMVYDELTVYIDKKYKPGTCEYKVIKNHENYHVAVAQQAMIFFKPDVEKEIQKSLQKVKPQIIKDPKDQDRVLKEQFTQVMNDLKPLIAHINAVTAQKNYEIDTPQSYAKTRALCKNW